MKQTITLCVILVLSLSICLVSAEGKWTGWITDEHCGAQGAKADHKECALKCMSEGKKLVFYNNSDKKIYPVDNQDLAKENLGHVVVIRGNLENGTIKISKIDPAPK
jgi:tRNA isopentenyl-2-thiomethyl-A-37 hydroxylase MiaE